VVEMESWELLPWLALNHNPPDLSLSSSYEYMCEPPALRQLMVLNSKQGAGGGDGKVLELLQEVVELLYTTIPAYTE
jgi:hypothetical protein